jgi:hypothetical protein
MTETSENAVRWSGVGALGWAVYQIQVFYADDDIARDTRDIDRAAEVMTNIPAVADAHQGCARIVVLLEGVELFALERDGERFH